MFLGLAKATTTLFHHSPTLTEAFSSLFDLIAPAAASGYLPALVEPTDSHHNTQPLHTIFPAFRVSFLLTHSGAGGILHYFREQGCSVKGIDLGEEYVEYGRKKYDLDLSLGTVHNLDHSKPPNLIIYSHVLEHILNPNYELQKVNNILTDVGLLYIEVPGVKNLMNNYEMDFLRLLQNAHTYHFTLRSLTNLLNRNGFELLVGNNIVNSVFRKAQNDGSTKNIEDEYSNVMAYLKKVDQRRKIYPIPPYKMKNLPKSIIISTLTAIGFFAPVRDLYHKIKAHYVRIQE